MSRLDWEAAARLRFHPTQVLILETLGERYPAALSSQMLADEHRLPTWHIAVHIRALRDRKLIELAYEEPAYGTTIQKFYGLAKAVVKGPR